MLGNGLKSTKESYKLGPAYRGLQDFPTEILAHVAGYLQFIDVHRLLSTCKTLNGIPMPLLYGQHDKNLLLYSILRNDVDRLVEVLRGNQLDDFDLSVVAKASDLMISCNASMEVIRILGDTLEVLSWETKYEYTNALLPNRLVKWVYENKTKEEFLEMDIWLTKVDRPIFFLAIEFNDLEMMNFILDADPESRDEIINWRVQGYPNPNSSGCAEYPIILATSHGFKDIVLFLLDNGASVENYDADDATYYTDDQEILDILNNYTRNLKRKELDGFLEDYRSGNLDHLCFEWDSFLSYATPAEFEEIVLGCKVEKLDHLYEYLEEVHVDKLKVMLRRQDLSEHFYAGTIDFNCHCQFRSNPTDHTYFYGMLYRFVKRGYYELTKCLLSDPRVDPMVHEANPFRSRSTLLGACLFKGGYYGAGLELIELILSHPKFSIQATKHRILRTALQELNNSQEQKDLVLNYLFAHPVVNPEGKFKIVETKTAHHVVEFLLDLYDPKEVWLDSVNETPVLVEFLIKDQRIDPSWNDNYAIKALTKGGYPRALAALVQDPRVDPAVNDNEPLKNAAKQTYHEGELVKILCETGKVDPRVENSIVFLYACQKSNSYRMGAVNFLYPLCDVTAVALLPTIKAENETLLERLLQDSNVQIDATTNSEIMEYLSTEFVYKNTLAILLKDQRFSFSVRAVNRFISNLSEEGVQLLLNHRSVDVLAIEESAINRMSNSACFHLVRSVKAELGKARLGNRTP